MNWNPGAEFLAQETHILLGILGPLIARIWFPWWYGAIVILIFAIVKEFTFDIIVEKSNVKEGIFDLAFYCLGILIAIMLVSI